MKSVVMNKSGGTDVIAFVDRPEPILGPGQALVEVAAAGVNFMDIGVRRGMAWNHMPDPKILGVEGAGRVIGVGENVHQVKPGDRVAWVYVPGSYSQCVVISADALVPIPDTIDDRTAAAVMMQGLTASHFATDFYPVQPGDIALVHAAAGGVGLLLTQIIKLRGGHVIGRVSSADKVAIAKQAGADHVVVDTDGNFAEEVLRLSGGQGVHVVYDGSGPTTFQGSLDSLRRSGTFCWYGPVLGGPGPLDIMSLPKSIKIGYATFFDHIATPELLRARSKQLFDWIAYGSLKINIGGIYPLAEAARAYGHGEPSDNGQTAAHSVTRHAMGGRPSTGGLTQLQPPIRADIVQKRLVVADDETGAVIGGQPCLDGFDRSEIQVIGGLVENSAGGCDPSSDRRQRRKCTNSGSKLAAELKARDLAVLQQQFGKSGPYFHWIARGIDEREVKPDRIRKSIGAEDTFRKDIQDLETASAGLQPPIDKVWRYCEANGIRGKSVTLKVKWEDFTQITRSKAVVAPVASPAEIANIVTPSSLDDDFQGEPQLAWAL